MGIFFKIKELLLNDIKKRLIYQGLEIQKLLHRVRHLEDKLNKKGE